MSEVEVFEASDFETCEEFEDWLSEMIAESDEASFSGNGLEKKYKELYDELFLEDGAVRFSKERYLKLFDAMLLEADEVRFKGAELDKPVLLKC